MFPFLANNKYGKSHKEPNIEKSPLFAVPTIELEENQARVCPHFKHEHRETLHIQGKEM